MADAIIRDRIRTIKQKLDQSAADYLLRNRKTHFYHASCLWTEDEDSRLIKAYEAGFHNYPFARTPAAAGFLFLEQLAGGRIYHQEGKTDSFHSWCEPCIHSIEDIHRLQADFDRNPEWADYINHITHGRDELSAQLGLPICFHAFTLVDLACNLCGAENLFVWMYEEEQAVFYLFDFLTQLYITAYKRAQTAAGRLVNGYGFPGIYCSDLQLANLPPELLRKFVLPCYLRAAGECGGAIISMGFAHPELVGQLLKQDEILGGSFDKRLKLDEIRRLLGNKLFVLHHYIYQDWLDKPTLVDGIYCNPIVQCYSRELQEVYDALADRCSLYISIERHTFEEVCRVKQQVTAMQ